MHSSEGLLLLRLSPYPLSLLCWALLRSFTRAARLAGIAQNAHIKGRKFEKQLNFSETFRKNRNKGKASLLPQKLLP